MMMMDVRRGGYIGSYDGGNNSIKLKQTVNLNRRTLSGLDNKLTRFNREKEKCTHLISREKEKFLEKQKRILPNIILTDTTTLDNNAKQQNLRPQSCQVKLPRSAPLTPILMKDTKREHFSFHDFKGKIYGGESNFTSDVKILPRVSSDEKIEKPMIEKTGVHQQPRFRRRSLSQPLMKRPQSVVNLITPDIERLRVGENSRSLTDLNTDGDHLDRSSNKQTNENGTRNSVAYEEVKGCRYLRRTKEQRNELETSHDRTCYCNSCSLTKIPFSPKIQNRRNVRSSMA